MRLLRAKKAKTKPTARDRQREATRARLLEAARKLFVEHGYEAVSVTDIGKEAGVSHAMIYANFGDKAGLLYEIVRQNNAPQLAEVQKATQAPVSARERIYKVLNVWARYDLADPELLAVMQAYSWTWSVEAEQENRQELDVHRACLASLIREGRAAGEFGGEIDALEAARAIFAIYTWGLRPGVFDGASARQCVNRIKPQVELLLT